MQKYLAVSAIILLVMMVMIRTLMMKKHGFKAMQFGKTDKKDFIIPPFVLFYFYLIFANTFNLPTIKYQELFHNETASWLGVTLCLTALLFMLWSLISFGNSFRVGIDFNKADRLITNGAFGISRNPIYVSFACVLIGQFLIFSSWILLIFVLAGILLFHRQVLLEEKFLKEHYGNEYLKYCKRVRRYL